MYCKTKLKNPNSINKRKYFSIFKKLTAIFDSYAPKLQLSPIEGNPAFVEIFGLRKLQYYKAK